MVVCDKTYLTERNHTDSDDSDDVSICEDQGQSNNFTEEALQVLMAQKQNTREAAHE